MDINKILTVLTVTTILFATSCGVTKKYEQTKATNSITAYENYLAKYPKSKYSDIAKQELAVLYEERDWSEAERIGTITAYKKFISDFPYGDYYSKATEKIKELEVILPEWEKASKRNSVEAYKLFLDKFPYSSYSSKAKDKLKELEYQGWSNAKQKNTVKSYENYLSEFPYGKFTEEVEKRIIDLEVDAIFKGDHGKLPPMSQTTSGYGSYEKESEIKVFNNTQYDLTLRYSGPQSKKVIFKPKEKKTIKLDKGKYRVTASVNVSSVTNYAGTEEIKGGMLYESEYWIETKQYWKYDR